ncbi:N-acetylneuraminate synthase family protein, partial [Methanoculleus sp. MH98A]|uniref:N-acetylneuraminate synthase family protein n=1 Tax=Methanoculleus sp. MH98A TaxID=1495314 RepID=UPI00350FACB0
MYAETAFIHEGDKNYLLELINSAKKAQCDGIKFQMLLDVDDAYVDSLDNYYSINKWCFTEVEWTEILSYGRDQGLEIVVLPIDEKALIYCTNHSELINAIELHSIALNDFQMLKRIKDLKDFPIILGVGGRTIDEIEYALNFILPENIPIIMYGMQNFPTDPHDVNLSKIAKLKAIYPSFVIGYADHTVYDGNGDLMIQLAYALGARIFEKHITLK